MSDLEDLEEITDTFEQQRLRRITPKLVASGKRFYCQTMESGNAKCRRPVPALVTKSQSQDHTREQGMNRSWGVETGRVGA